MLPLVLLLRDEFIKKNMRILNHIAERKRRDHSYTTHHGPW